MHVGKLHVRGFLLKGRDKAGTSCQVAASARTNRVEASTLMRVDLTELTASHPHPHLPHFPAALPVSTPLHAAYAAAIGAELDSHETATGATLGALLMEPVLQGAGGMLCVDPDFQRALVEVCGGTKQGPRTWRRH